jgi:hypothetical protein
MFRFEVGLSLYLLGNLLILIQNWLGMREQGQKYRHNGKWRGFFILVLIGAFYFGALVGIAGLIVLLTVIWWMPLVVFFFGHPIFRKYFITSKIK